MECGLVGDGESVGSCGQATPLFKAVDAPLDGVALLVGIRIEAGRARTSAAPAQTVADLVRRLRDDRADLLHRADRRRRTLLGRRRGVPVSRDRHQVGRLGVRLLRRRSTRRDPGLPPHRRTHRLTGRQDRDPRPRLLPRDRHPGDEQSGGHHCGDVHRRQVLRPRRRLRDRPVAGHGWDQPGGPTLSGRHCPDPTEFPQETARPHSEYLSLCGES